MAKNKIQIEVSVNDKGSLKLTKSGAAALNKELDKTGTSARNVDRFFKGASKQSSNATKNFSKMSQGLTGSLVPAYAVLASNVFALGAAFRFLKNAADVSILIESQESYAASTGVALKSITLGLQEASGGMLQFQQAAEAAAIGAAKGFSPEQLEDLASGAKKAAAALGRDFEDAFSRLLRGTSKAEPELLDELGITLRLKDATEAYGDAIGKNAKDLTTYERSQAVLLETQRQLNDQFGEIETKSNPFQQLSVTFDDLVKTVSQGILPVFTVMAEIINSSTLAAVAVFGSLAVSIIKTIIPTEEFTKRLQAWGSTVSLDKARAELDSYKAKLITTEDRIKMAKGSLQEFAAQAASMQKKQSKQIAAIASGVVTPQSLAGVVRSTKGALAQIEAQGKVTSGVLVGVSKETIRSLQASAYVMQRSMRESAKVSLTAWQAFGLRFKVIMGSVTVGAKAAAAAVGQAFVRAVALASKALSLAGWVGIFLLVIEAAKNLQGKLYNIFRGVSNFIDKILGTDLTTALDNSAIGEWAKATQEAAENTKKWDEFVERLDKRVVTFGEDLSAVATKLKNFEAPRQALTFSSFVSTAGLASTLKAIDELGKQDGRQNEAADAFERIKKSILPLSKEMPLLASYFRESGSAAEVLARGYGTLEEKTSSAIASNNAYLESKKSLDDALRKGTNLQGLISLRIAIEAAAMAAKQADETLTDAAKGANYGYLNEINDDYAELAINLITLEARTRDLIVTEEALAYQRTANRKEGAIAQKRLSSLLKLRAQEVDITEKQLEIDTLVARQKNMNADEQVAAEETILGKKSQLRIAEDALIVEKQLATTGGRLGKTFQDSFQTGVKGLFNDIITNAETSVQDALLNLSKNILTSLADTVSTRLTEIVFNVDEKDDPAATMKKAIEGGASVGATDIKSKIIDAFKEFEAIGAGIETSFEKPSSELTASAGALQESATALTGMAAAEAEARERAIAALEAKFGPTTPPKELASNRDDAITRAAEIKEEYERKKANQPIVQGYGFTTGNIIEENQPTGEAASMFDVEGLWDNVTSLFEIGAAGAMTAPVPSPIEKISEVLPDDRRDPRLSTDFLLSEIIGSKQAAPEEVLPALIAATETQTAVSGAVEEAIIVSAQTSGEKAEANTANIRDTIASGTTAVVEAITANAPQTTPAVVQQAEDEGLVKSNELIGKPASMEDKIVNADSKDPDADPKKGFVAKLGGIFEGSIKGFKDIFSGDNPFLEGLGSLFSGVLGDFSGIFSSLIGSLFGGSGGGGAAEGIAGLVLSAATSYFAGPTLAAANGAVFGGGFRAFADGGTVNKPTLGLIGEGRYNEAIVPLPNGRSIPVEMSGSNSGTNNNQVSVNIDMGSGQSKTESSDQQAAAMGNVIADLIQRELADQSRPGGLLARR